MTRPIYEPSLQRTDARLGYGSNQLFRRPGQRSPGRFVGIVFSSVDPVVVEDDAGAWFLVIPADLGGTTLTEAEAGVYSPDSAGVEIQVRNVTNAVDMLSTAITIDSGENTSYTAATPPVIDVGNAGVSTGDIVVVDVDDATDALGLDIILAFG